MAKQLNDCQVVTGEVRLSFVHLFEPTKVSENDKEAKYGCTIILDKVKNATDIAAIQAAQQKALEKGLQKHFNGRKPAVLTHTLQDGDEAVDDMGELKKIKYPEYDGCYFMRLSTKFAPKVLGADGKEITDPTLVYSGCYGRVSLTCFAYSGDGRRGISAVLNNVMKTNDGDPLTSQLSGDEFGVDASEFDN